MNVNAWLLNSKTVAYVVTTCCSAAIAGSVHADSIDIAESSWISQSVNGSASYHDKSGLELWNSSYQLYLRERPANDSKIHRRTAAFIKFSLAGLEKDTRVVSATLRLHQMDRLNKLDHYAPLQIARVLSDWDVSAPNLPDASTPLDSAFIFADNRQFGLAPSAKGFYEIDVTNIVADWHQNRALNYGFQLSFAQPLLAGLALSTDDDSSTPEDERPILRVVVEPNSEQPAASPRPNIVLVMSDDQGWADASYMAPSAGNNRRPPQTPNLDAMARNGLVFNRFYAGSPVCSPTRATVITGKTNYRVGIPKVGEGHLPIAETTLAETLLAAGYRTGHFGKWHLGSMSTAIKDSSRGGNPKYLDDYSPPWEHGFQVSFSTEANVPTFDPMKKLGAADSPISYDDRNYYGTAYWTHSSIDGIAPQRHPNPDAIQGDDSTLIVTKATEFIERAKADKQPFFAVIWLHSVHKPIVYDASLETALYEEGYFEGFNSSQREYALAVTAMDRAVGQLRDALAANGLRDNTMLWFTSDNGPEDGLGDAGLLRGNKRFLYEGGIRVPGLLEWPAVINQPATTDVPAVTMDYYPTILDYLNLAAPNDSVFDGISLRQLIENPVTTTTRGSAIGFGSHKSQWAWIKDQYKLIAQKSSSGFVCELYDIVNDPAETTDLSTQFPSLTEQMRAELAVWIDSIDPTLPR